MQFSARQLLVSALITALAGVAPSVGAADAPASVLRVKTFAGSPPFQRRVVPVESADAEFARFETTAATEKSQWVDFRGSPPYQRKFNLSADTEVVEFARFEEIEASADKPRRYGPPGKLNSRRR